MCVRACASANNRSVIDWRTSGEMMIAQSHAFRICAQCKLTSQNVVLAYVVPARGDSRQMLEPIGLEKLARQLRVVLFRQACVRVCCETLQI